MAQAALSRGARRPVTTTLHAMESSDPHAEYLRFLERVKPGAPLTEDEWLFHFDHQNRDATSGREVGERAPAFALSDHHGENRTLTDLAGERGLLLVFARSANW
jgi:hypothetical protein